jgi:hypothetical protein
VQAVEELDQEAGILGGDGAHPKPTFFLRTTDLLPGHEAIGSTNLVRGSPEEGAVEPVEGGEHARGKLERTHGEGGQGIQDGLRRTSLPPADRRRARQAERYLSTLAIRGLNAARRSF